MTGTDFDNMTLLELEGVAARLSAAVAIIRDARALLGVQSAPAAPIVSAVVAPAPPPAAVDPRLSDWVGSAERARLLAQIRGESGAQEAAP